MFVFWFVIINCVKLFNMEGDIGVVVLGVFVDFVVFSINFLIDNLFLFDFL